jgi:hypothetical protein
MASLGVTYHYEEQCIIELAQQVNASSICSFCSRMKRGRWVLLPFSCPFRLYLRFALLCVVLCFFFFLCFKKNTVVYRFVVVYRFAVVGDAVAAAVLLLLLLLVLLVLT